MPSKIRRFLRYVHNCVTPKHREKRPNVPVSTAPTFTPHNSILEDEEDEFIKTTEITILLRDGSEKLIHARAIFDTACPYNLMSSSIANLVGLEFDEEKKTPELTGLGGGQFVATGEAHARFRIMPRHRTIQGDPLKYHPRFYKARFMVSERIEDFDILIGKATIREYGLVKLTDGLGAFPAQPPFRPAPSNHNAGGKQWFANVLKVSSTNSL